MWGVSCKVWGVCRVSRGAWRGVAWRGVAWRTVGLRELHEDLDVGVRGVVVLALALVVDDEALHAAPLRALLLRPTRGLNKTHC